MRWHDMDAWDWAWMTAMMIAFWAVLITAVALVVRSGRRDSPRPTAEDVLADRFARGEISLEEFEERQTALTRHRRPRRR
jgi:putative membrane protein